MRGRGRGCMRRGMWTRKGRGRGGEPSRDMAAGKAGMTQRCRCTYAWRATWTAAPFGLPSLHTGKPPNVSIFCASFSGGWGTDSELACSLHARLGHGLTWPTAGGAICLTDPWGKSPHSCPSSGVRTHLVPDVPVQLLTSSSRTQRQPPRRDVARLVRPDGAPVEIESTTREYPAI